MLLNKKNILALAIMAIVSFACFYFTAYLQSFSFNIAFFIGNIFYFITGTWVFYRYRQVRTAWLLLLLAPLLLIRVPMHIMDFSETTLSLPNTVSHITTLLLAYSVTATSGINWKKITLVISYAMLIIAFNTAIYPLLNNKVNYGLYNSIINEPAVAFNFVTSDNVPYTTANVAANEAIILDFWNSKCGACYKGFPAVDEAFKNNTSKLIKIFTVNVPIMDEQPADNFGLLQRYNYSFNQLFATGEQVAKNFNIIAYPTTIVLHNNKVVFKGKFTKAYEYALTLTK